jgi:putative flippase GtrA
MDDFKGFISKWFSRMQFSVREDGFRFLRFLLVGASGLVVNNGSLVFFTEIVGMHYLLSAVLATQCSTFWNFLFTEIWVFKDRKNQSRSKRLVSFYLMNNAALLLRGPLLTLMVSALGIHYLLSNLTTLLLIALLRFTISDRFIWTPIMKNYQKKQFNYDIHNIVGIESWIQLPELEFFMVSDLSRDPDIRLRPDRRRHFRPSPQSIHYKESLGRFGFEFSIDIGECTNIQVSSLVEKSPHVLYTNIFEPILRWTMVRKGFALVHAACLTLEGQSVLITAQTDTGKTSTILELLQNNNGTFLSDDMVILDHNGLVFNYPKPLTISLHTLKALRNTNLNFKERVSLQIQSRIHSRSGRKFALWLSRSGLPVASINAAVQFLIPPPKYMIDRLIQEVKISESSSLSFVFQIERGAELSEKLDLEQILEMLEINAEDAYGFPPYPQIADMLSKWEKQDLHPVEKEIVRDGVSGKVFWRLSDPSYGWWKDIFKVIQHHSRS